MIKRLIIFLLAGLYMCQPLCAQKNITEAVMLYDIAMQTPDGKPLTNSLSGSSFTLYIKGNLSRTDMTSSLGSEKTILDTRQGNAVVLKEYSGQKLMITLTKEEWQLKNKKNDQVEFTFDNTTKTINGYLCTKATAKLADGNEIVVFFTKELQIANNNYNILFKNLPGMPLYYEYSTPKLKFVYSINKIDFGSVPANRFEFPKSGYRVLTYTEALQSEK
jgi:GLPGLI family protein